MRVVLLQRSLAWGDPEANLSHLDQALDNNPGADLYVLPEMFTTGFATLPDANVEEEPSQGLAWMKAAANRTGAAIAGSIALRTAEGCRNRFYFVKPEIPGQAGDDRMAGYNGIAGDDVMVGNNKKAGDDGAAGKDGKDGNDGAAGNNKKDRNDGANGSVTVYDKRHLFTYGGEQERFSAGHERVITEWRGWRFLLTVCYDLRFPIWLRNRDDYDAIICVANWPDKRRYHWDTLLRARAIENQCYVLGVNRVGEDPVCVYDGGTVLLDPYGNPVASCPDSTQCECSGELDMKMIQDYRAKFPVLEDADIFELK